jgi:hypothetical protein
VASGVLVAGLAQVHQVKPRKSGVALDLSFGKLWLTVVCAFRSVGRVCGVPYLVELVLVVRLFAVGPRQMGLSLQCAYTDTF